MSDHLNVLILEDNDADSALMVKELERAGFNFDWTQVKSQKGYVNALEDRPDLILSDYSLPQFNGLEALKILNKKGLKIPLIVITGSPSEEVAVACIKGGAADYLSKGRLSRLGKVVAQALAEKEVREINQEATQFFRENEINRGGQNELETIVRVNAALRTAPDRASMLPVITGLLQEIAQVQGIAIALKHPASGDIVIEAAGGAWKKWEDHYLIPEKEISGASLDGEIFTCKDINNNPRVKQVSIFNDLTAVACFPLISQEQSIGILWVGCRQPITEERLELIRVIANIGANALYRTTLYENNLRALQESQAIAEITRSLNENLDLDIIFRLIVNAATSIIPNSTWAVVHLFDEKNKSLHAVAVSPADEGNLQDSNFRKIWVTSSGEFDFGKMEETERKAAAMRSGYGIAGIVIEKGETVIVRDVTTDERYLKPNHISDIRSLTVAPILNAGRRLGTISVLSNEPNTFSPTDEGLLNNLSIQAASAIENARLYTKLEAALVTEKKTRQKLILADKLAGMGRMVASVAHELNNPLQTIKNCLFLLDHSFISQDDVEMLELATSEVERLSGIVDRLREVYRPRSEESFEPTVITPLLAEVAILLETHLRRNKVALTMEFQETNIPIVEGFPDKLKQVFINLSLNAIESMRPDGGTLTIRTSLSKDGKEAGVSFSDNGPGISEEEMLVIFDPFFSTKETGMGLGLTICYDIMENHNGRITVTNNPDKGATFTVWLPLSDVRK